MQSAKPCMQGTFSCSPSLIWRLHSVTTWCFVCKIDKTHGQINRAIRVKPYLMIAHLFSCELLDAAKRIHNLIDSIAHRACWRVCSVPPIFRYMKRRQSGANYLLLAFARPSAALASARALRCPLDKPGRVPKNATTRALSEKPPPKQLNIKDSANVPSDTVAAHQLIFFSPRWTSTQELASCTLLWYTW